MERISNSSILIITKRISVLISYHESCKSVHKHEQPKDGREDLVNLGLNLYWRGHRTCGGGERRGGGRRKEEGGRD